MSGLNQEHPIISKVYMLQNNDNEPSIKDAVVVVVVAEVNVVEVVVVVGVV